MSAHRRSVLVCRGCCCGTARKHPDVDHDGQLATWRATAARVPLSRVHTVGCLDVCERSNVVVLRDASSRRRVWLAAVNDAARTEALTRWLAAGDGLDALPDELRACVFERHPDAPAVSPIEPPDPVPVVLTRAPLAGAQPPR